VLKVIVSFVKDKLRTVVAVGRLGDLRLEIRIGDLLAVGEGD